MFKFEKLPAQIFKIYILQLRFTTKNAICIIFKKESSIFLFSHKKENEIFRQYFDFTL